MISWILLALPAKIIYQYFPFTPWNCRKRTFSSLCLIKKIPFGKPKSFLIAKTACHTRRTMGERGTVHNIRAIDVCTFFGAEKYFRIPFFAIAKTTVLNSNPAHFPIPVPNFVGISVFFPNAQHCAAWQIFQILANLLPDYDIVLNSGRLPHGKKCTCGGESCQVDDERRHHFPPKKKRHFKTTFFHC